MSLTRVAVIGGPEGGGGNGWDDHARAAAELRSVLTDQGIAIAGPGDPADGIIALPGGRVSLGDLLVGCLEGSSADDKPCGLLNTGNYFSDLLKATEDRVVELFARESQRGRLVVERDPVELVRALREYLPPETRRNALGSP